MQKKRTRDQRRGKEVWKEYGGPPSYDGGLLVPRPTLWDPAHQQQQEGRNPIICCC